MRVSHVFNVILALASTRSSYAEDETRKSKFLEACARGYSGEVEEYVQEDPRLPKAYSRDGETCLHLASISKSLEVAQLMVKHGADVNFRVTHDQGLRMTPLSWHTYGGNYETVKLLLDHGADVNAEFDYAVDSDEKITALDVISRLLENRGDDDEPDEFTATQELLISRGGKKFTELE